MYADMPQPSQWIFRPLTLPILKTIINLQNYNVNVATSSTKGRTLESYIVYFCNIEDNHISQGQEKVLMLVVWWYISVSSFAGLGNYLPRSGADPYT